MTTTYNTQRLAKAVFSSNTQVVKKIIESGDFNHDILSDVIKGWCTEPEEYSIYEGIPPIPLYYISLCNKIYLDSHWWKDPRPIAGKEMPALAKEYLKRCTELLDYWQSIGYDVSTPIDFSKYRKICAPFLHETFEYLMFGDMETMLKRGYNKDEIDLTYALMTYDKTTIFELLEKRVNPNVWMSATRDAGHCDPVCAQNGFEIIIDSIADYNHGLLLAMEKPWLISSVSVRSVFAAAAYQEIMNKIEELDIPLGDISIFHYESYLT